MIYTVFTRAGLPLPSSLPPIPPSPCLPATLALSPSSVGSVQQRDIKYMVYIAHFCDISVCEKDWRCRERLSVALGRGTQVT